eukprot:6222706-Pyramimonas_sp.AAC.1
MQALSQASGASKKRRRKWAPRTCAGANRRRMRAAEDPQARSVYVVTPKYACTVALSALLFFDRFHA